MVKQRDTVGVFGAMDGQGMGYAAAQVRIACVHERYNTKVTTKELGRGGVFVGSVSWEPNSTPETHEPIVLHLGTVCVCCKPSVFSRRRNSRGCVHLRGWLHAITRGGNSCLEKSNINRGSCSKDFKFA